jgi:glycosyltransferase involved in cell wall biosynthesis
MTPEVSIIICTYNRDAYIEESIKAIFEQSTDRNLFELIVINNNSTDKTDEICKTLNRKYTSLTFRYYLEFQQGLSFARNRGIKEAKGNILAFIDDDAIAEKDFICNLLTFYRLHPEVSATGGRIYPRFEVKKPKWLSSFLLPLISVLDLGNYPKPFPFKKYPIGANMALRREVIAKVLDFNTLLGRNGENLQGGEEKDLFIRIRANGFSIWYIPNAIVHHVISASRLKPEFIKKLGTGIGRSECIRSTNISKQAFLKSILIEIFKWITTIIISIGYFLTFQIEKATMLYKFRAWVTSGLLNIENKKTL